MNAVTWFEIPAAKLARAKKFYERVLGITLTHLDMGPAAMETFPNEQEAPGCGGALVMTDGYTPSHEGTLVYFEVSDIAGTLAKVGAEGGRTLVPKMEIGEFGFIALFQDTEGNRLGLHAMQ